MARKSKATDTEPATPAGGSREAGFRLTDGQIEQITDALRAGRPLPPHLFPHIFEAPKEYELTYRGKARRADVLAETMAVPLQVVRTYGEPNGDGWSNKLVLGDNLQVLRTLVRLKQGGKLRCADGTDGARLCYIDPPFATRREFQGSRDERAYEDRVAGAEFVEFLRKRLILIHELLAWNGTLYLHLDTRKVHYMKVVLDEIFGEGNFRNELIWQRTTSHSDSQRFGAVHETVLAYDKSATNRVWNTQYVPYSAEFIATYYKFDDGDGRKYWTGDLTAPGLRSGETGQPWQGVDPGKVGRGRHWVRTPTELDRLDSEGRIFWPKKGGVPKMKRYLDEMPGLAVPDVWTDISGLGGLTSAAAERTGFPTQKPEKLVSRIIEASSNPGDLVLDCFAGSGTTLVAAERAQSGERRWIGIDSSKFAVYVTQAQLLRLAGKKSPKQPFTLFNAGLYDYKALRELPWESYREFVLELFQCRPNPVELGGAHFDGYLGDHLVLVYDFVSHPEATIGREYVEDIFALCGDRLGSRCFIVAPAVMVEPYEDYLDVQGTRFFFLRIPYSIIAELHKRAFTELRQPSSEQLLNATIDAVGFDFVIPPDVDRDLVRVDDFLETSIRSFFSEAYFAAEGESDIANLAMVMVDFDYDGEVFDLDDVHFAEDLEREGWRFRVPASLAGDQMMTVYLDIYGNEYRETTSPDDFSPSRSTGRKKSGAKPRPTPAKRKKPSESRTASSKPSKKSPRAAVERKNAQNPRKSPKTTKRKR